MSPSVGRHAKTGLLRRTGEVIGRHARTAVVLGAVALVGLGVQNRHTVENLGSGVEQTLSALNNGSGVEATPLVGVDLLDAGGQAAKLPTVKAARSWFRGGASRQTFHAPGKIDGLYAAAADQGYHVVKTESSGPTEAKPDSAEVSLPGLDEAIHETADAGLPASEHFIMKSEAAPAVHQAVSKSP